MRFCALPPGWRPGLEEFRRFAAQQGCASRDYFGQQYLEGGDYASLQPAIKLNSFTRSHGRGYKLSRLGR